LRLPLPSLAGTLGAMSGGGAGTRIAMFGSHGDLSACISESTIVGARTRVCRFAQPEHVSARLCAVFRILEPSRPGLLRQLLFDGLARVSRAFDRALHVSGGGA
jgi:hypothetical protein